jgi:hypothetical protein
MFMKVNVFLVVVFAAISSCKEEKKPEVHYVQTEEDYLKGLSNRPLMKNGKYVFLSAGFPNFEYYNAVDSLSNKWKIVYDNLGCSLSEGMSEVIDEHNKRVEQLIEMEHGKGWKAKYEREIDDIIKRNKKRYYK